MPTFTKEMALEIIAAGFKSMARKYHPDVGGTHEQMLDLTATKEELERRLSGGSRTDYRQEQANQAYRDRMRRERQERDDRARAYARAQSRGEHGGYWRNQKETPKEDVPIEPYPHDDDYFQLADVTIMAVSEKAIKIKISGVKGPQWLPKSQLHEDMDGNLFVEGEVLTVVFTRWIAQQKGWLK